MKNYRRKKTGKKHDKVDRPVGSTGHVLFFDKTHNPTDQPAAELLTIRDVARLFKISQSTVRRLQARRLIPFIKVGGGIRFAPDDVASFLARLRTDRVGLSGLWQHDK